MLHESPPVFFAVIYPLSMPFLQLTGAATDKSESLCSQLLSEPLPDPLPKTIEEFEAFLASGRVPVSGVLYLNLTRAFPSLTDKLTDMGSDQSLLVAHFTSSIDSSMSSLPPG